MLVDGELTEPLRTAAPMHRPAATGWPAEDAPVFDVQGMLVAAARHKRDVSGAYEDIVRHIRMRTGDGRPVVLNLDLPALEHESFRTVLRWAVRTMQADLVEARSIDPTVETPRSLRLFRSYLDMVAVPRSLADGPRQAGRAIISEVDRIRSLYSDGTDMTPAALPAELSILGLDAAYLARHVARALGTRVRMDVTGPDGLAGRRWVDEQGRIYAFDPVTSDGAAVPASATSISGLLPDRLRDDVDAFGVEDDLGRLQGTSWRSGQTFDDVVSDEIDRRRERLISVHAELPELFERAWTIANVWKKEIARVASQNADLRSRATDVTTALERLRSQLRDRYGEWFGAAHGTAGRGEAERAVLATAIARLEREQKEIEEELSSLRERESDLTRGLAIGRPRAGRAERLLGELRTLAREGAETVQWHDHAVRSLRDELAALRLEPGEPRYTTEDDQRLIAPDGQVLELLRPAGSGNGFFGAVAEGLRHQARRPGLDAKTVVALERGAERDPYYVVYGARRLPDGLVLDPDIRFSPEDLQRAGVALTYAQGKSFLRSGGRLPDDLELTGPQRQALLRAHIYGASGWDAGTTVAAAAMFARSLRTDIVIVRADGTHQRVHGADSGSDRVVTVYEWSGAFSAAVPTVEVRDPALSGVFPATAQDRPGRPADAKDASPATSQPLPDDEEHTEFADWLIWSSALGAEPAEPAGPARSAGSAGSTEPTEPTESIEPTDARGLPVGLARTGRFGATGRIGNLDQVTEHLKKAIRDTAQRDGHPEQVAELALQHLAETRNAIGDQEWGDWLAHGGDEVTVTLPDGRTYRVKAELVPPASGIRETSPAVDPDSPEASEKVGLAWDPEADMRVSSAQERSVSWNVPIPLVDVGKVVSGSTLTGGLTASAGFTRTHGSTYLSVIQGRRTTPTGSEVWFGYPGAHLEVTIHPHGSKTVIPLRSEPLDVTVVVPGSHVPRVPRGADGLPQPPQPLPPIALPDILDRSPETQRRLDDVIWQYNSSPESMDIPERLRDRLLDSLGPYGMEPGSESWRRLRLFLSERNQLRLYTHQAWPGLPSEEFPVRGGSAGLTLRTTLLSVRRIEGADLDEVTTWKQQRSTEISGVTSAAGTEWELGPSFGAGYSKFGLGCQPVTLTVGGSVGQSLDLGEGVARWQKLSTTGPTVAYELGVLFTAKVRSDLPQLRGEKSEAGTVHMQVPLADAPEFEAALQRAAAGSPHPLTPVSANDEALVPPVIRDGRGAGPSYIELDGSAREVREHVIRNIEQARKGRGLPPFTEMQEHHVHRQVAVDFGLDGLSVRGTHLASPRGLRRRLVLPDGSSAMIKIEVKRDAKLLYTGARADRTLTLLRGMAHTQSSEQALGAWLKYGLDVTAKLPLTMGLIRTIGGKIKFRGSRKHIDSLSNSPFVLAGGWPIIKGPSRLFEYQVDFKISVTIDAPTAKRKGPPAIEPEASGALGPPLAERSREAAPSTSSVAGLFRKKASSPITRTSVVKGGRIKYWIPEQLVFPSQTDARPVDVSNKPHAFLVPKDLRERRRPEDLPLDVALPPELARELTSMLKDTTAFTVDEMEEMVDQVSDPGRLLVLLLRGLDDGSVQTKLLRAGALMGDHHLAVRLSAELQTSQTHTPDKVRSGELFIAERTPVVASGEQRSRGWSVSGQLGLSIGSFPGFKVAPAVTGTYGRTRAATKSVTHRATVGRIHIADPVEYDHRFADVVFTLEVEHSRNTPFGRSILRNHRRIRVRDGYEFLRRASTNEPRGDVPESLESHELQMSGVTQSLLFPKANPDPDSVPDQRADVSQRPAKNPLVDTVIDLLRTKVPALLNQTRDAIASELPLMADDGPVQPLDEVLSPLSLLAMERRLMSTGLRLTPLGIAADHYILIKGASDGDFHHEEPRGELAVGRYLNPVEWSTEIDATDRQFGFAVDVPFTRSGSGDLTDGTDTYSYTWNRSRNVSAGRIESDASFNLVLFSPGSQLYAGKLRLEVAVKRVVQPSPVIVNRILVGLPDRLRAAYHHADDPATDETREVTMVKQVAVSDDLLPPVGAMAAKPDPRVRLVRDPTAIFRLGAPPDALRPFPVDNATVRKRDVVLWNLDDVSVGEMHRLLLEALRGSKNGRPTVRFTGPELLFEWGAESEETLRDLLSSNFLGPFFSHTLAEQGYRSPSVARPGGPMTDTHGRITVKAKLFDAKAIKWVNVSHDLEDSHRTRQASGIVKTTSRGLSTSLDASAQTGPSSSPAVSPSADGFGRTTNELVASTVTAQGVVGGGTFRQRPDQRYLYVRTGVAYAITLESAEQRATVTYGRQTRTFYFILDDAAALLVHPNQVNAQQDALDMTLISAARPGQPQHEADTSDPDQNREPKNPADANPEDTPTSAHEASANDPSQVDWTRSSRCFGSATCVEAGLHIARVRRASAVNTIPARPDAQGVHTPIR